MARGRSAAGRITYLLLGFAIGILLTIETMRGRLDALRLTCDYAVFVSLKRGCTEKQYSKTNETCDQITTRTFQDFRDITKLREETDAYPRKNR